MSARMKSIYQDLELIVVMIEQLIEDGEFQGKHIMEVQRRFDTFEKLYLWDMRFREKGCAGFCKKLDGSNTEMRETDTWIRFSDWSGSKEIEIEEGDEQPGDELS